MKIALEVAELAPDSIDLINAHATSTPLGDPAEYRAAKIVFGDHADKVAVHSTKSMTGHLLGATGGVEAIATIMAFERGVVHESINVVNQDPEIRFSVVTDGPREMKIEHALSNGFGFGGQNSAVVLSRFDG
jgi:3-oxoacyl-[acyl-carrier-protein] synthase II